MAKPEKDSSAKPEEQLTQTPLSEVKKAMQAAKDGELVKLPISGLVFRLKKPSISKLLRSDAIPSELVATAMKLDADQFEPKNKAEYVQSLDVIDEVVLRAAVEPVLVKTQDEVNESSICIEDLDDGDKIAIFLFAQTGVKPLTNFRENEERGDAGSTVSTVPGKTS